VFNFTHDDGEAVVMNGAPGLCRSKDRGPSPNHPIEQKTLAGDSGTVQDDGDQ